MPTYEFGVVKIIAPSKIIADTLIKSLTANPSDKCLGRLILLPKKIGAKRINVDLPSGEYNIIFQQGDIYTYTGNVNIEGGATIVLKALDTMNHSQKLTQKLRLRKINSERKQKIKELNNIIQAFELRIPDNVKQQYNRIKDCIDAKSITYLSEMYQAIYVVIGYPEPKSWDSILNWFEMNVINNDRYKYATFFELRKAFVTTVIKMHDCISASSKNTMGSIREGKRDDYWSEYTGIQK